MHRTLAIITVQSMVTVESEGLDPHSLSNITTPLGVKLLKLSMVCLQCESCVIHTRALQR